LQTLHRISLHSGCDLIYSKERHELKEGVFWTGGAQFRYIKGDVQRHQMREASSVRHEDEGVLYQLQ